ncbi:MAG: HAD-IA family hydrolase [Phycisphaerales bacterium]|nr:HAD-IA family hydrolase [Phycisphaerales bacterium]
MKSPSIRPSSSLIRLVCFDLGGVLVRICRSWSEACRAAGFELRGQWLNGDPPFNGWRALGIQLGSGAIDCRNWARQISVASDGLYSVEEILAIHDAFLIEEYEGVGAVIDRIHQSGIQTAALSNTNADHWARMDEFPAVMRLQHRLASHELRLHKPDPAIYREAQKRLRRRGDEILFFDDMPENVQAAREVGWNALVIDPHTRTDLQIEAGLVQHGLHRQRSTPAAHS